MQSSKRFQQSLHPALSDRAKRQCTTGTKRYCDSDNSLDDLLADAQYVDSTSEGLEDDAVQSGDWKAKFTVAADFGTTFSSVGFHHHQDDLNRPGHPNIRFIQAYPDGISQDHGKAKEVPTEILYDDHPAMRKWALHGRKPSSWVLKQSSLIKYKNEMRKGLSDEPEHALLWGYSVTSFRRDVDIQTPKLMPPLTCFKLLLDQSSYTQAARKEVMEILNKLKNKGIITSDEDPIVDYLTLLFRHTKSQLMDYTADWLAGQTPHFARTFDEDAFDRNCQIEFVLCVPPMWSVRALQTMQMATTQAIKQSGFGQLVRDCTENLFIVSETEAGAEFILRNMGSIKQGETFLLIDAGGGTVDAIIYRVTRKNPIRLEKEVVKEGGVLCGSSLLNTNFEEFLRDKLINETYLAKNRKALEENGKALEGIIKRRTIEVFETGWKRDLDLANVPRCTKVLRVTDLSVNSSKIFRDLKVTAEHSDFVKIFNPVLEPIMALQRSQLLAARNASLMPSRVILIGGFAGSPSLKYQLRRGLKAYHEEFGTEIGLQTLATPSTAVTCGAILRALQKRDGPQRISRASFGFRYLPPYDFSDEVHKKSKPWYSKLTQQSYVRNAIDWFIKEGEYLHEMEEFGPIPLHHVFDSNEMSKPEGDRFICEEVLYVAYERKETDYPCDHPHNAGAEILGTVVTDMSALVDAGKINLSPYDGSKDPVYAVEFELRIKVWGRNLCFEAVWTPPVGYSKSPSVCQSQQISIAAAFRPGTE